MAELKTRYKYIHFGHLNTEMLLNDDKEGDTNNDIWECRNNETDMSLGEIEYYPPWRQYVITFNEDCVFNNECLRDIAHFLKQLKERK